MQSREPTSNESRQVSVEAAQTLGLYLVIAATVLGVFGVAIALILRLSLEGFGGWYYVFLAGLLAAHLLYQRLSD